MPLQNLFFFARPPLLLCFIGHVCPATEPECASALGHKLMLGHLEEVKQPQTFSWHCILYTLYEKTEEKKECIPELHHTFTPLRCILDQCLTENK